MIQAILNRFDADERLEMNVFSQELINDGMTETEVAAKLTYILKRKEATL